MGLAGNFCPLVSGINGHETPGITYTNNCPGAKPWEEGSDNEPNSYLAAVLLTLGDRG